MNTKTFVIVSDNGRVKAAWLPQRRLADLQENIQTLQHAEDFLNVRTDGGMGIYLPQSEQDIDSLNDCTNAASLSVFTVERIRELYLS